MTAQDQVQTTRAARRFIDEISGRNGTDAVWGSFDCWKNSADFGLSAEDREILDQYTVEYAEDADTVDEEVMFYVLARTEDLQAAK